MLPTPETYTELQAAFDFFNQHLFGAKLPGCLITLQRERRTYGYFSSARFARHTGEVTDEIAMNPRYFAVLTMEDTLSTLVHEMAHAWQFHFGRPSRRGYHNHEWAHQMEKIGLMPSSTGAPGGRRVGQRMDHYILSDGPFQKACKNLLTSKFQISWFDRFPPAKIEGVGEHHDTTNVATLLAKGLLYPAASDGSNKTNRIKYRCPGCRISFWAKPGLSEIFHGGACAGVAFQPGG